MPETQPNTYTNCAMNDMYKTPNTPVKNTFFTFPNILSFPYGFIYYLNCVSGFWCQVPDRPRNNLNERGQQSPTRFKRHLRQPLQGECYHSQRFYRHSVFSRLFTTPCRIQPICLSSSVETMSAP